MDFRKQLIKKLFGKGDKAELAPPPWKLCINCLKTIPEEDKICNECGHNQSLPVKKRPTSIHEMAEAIGRQASTGQQDIIDFINRFAGEPIKNQDIMNRVYVEIMTAKLSIFYIIILINYKNNYNYSKIVDGIETEINKRFNDIFSEDKNDEVWRYFRRRLNQYLDAFKDESPFETISTILQFILEQTIAGTDFEALEVIKPLKIIAKEWAYPLVMRKLDCAIYVGNYMKMFALLNNKWEIT